MKKNNKAQALVEFVLIIPIMLMLIFAIIDFSKIFYEKTKLENNTNDIIEFIKNNQNSEDIEEYIKRINKNTTVKMTDKDNNYKEVVLTKEIKITTPGLNLVIGNPYKIKVKRVYQNEN